MGCLLHRWFSHAGQTTLRRMFHKQRNYGNCRLATGPTDGMGLITSRRGESYQCIYFPPIENQVSVNLLGQQVCSGMRVWYPFLP